MHRYRRTHKPRRIRQHRRRKPHHPPPPRGYFQAQTILEATAAYHAKIELKRGRSQKKTSKTHGSML